VQLEGLGQLKNLITSSRIEPVTFRMIIKKDVMDTACSMRGG
jgi:hypothetical protein